jgi:hypothetical protein
VTGQNDRQSKPSTQQGKAKSSKQSKPSKPKKQAKNNRQSFALMQSTKKSKVNPARLKPCKAKKQKSPVGL